MPDGAVFVVVAFHVSRFKDADVAGMVAEDRKLVGVIGKARTDYVI